MMRECIMLSIVGVIVGILLLIIGVIILTNKERKTSSIIIGVILMALGVWIALQIIF